MLFAAARAAVPTAQPNLPLLLAMVSPRRDFETALKTDGARDVCPILGAPGNLDIAADRFQLGCERGEVRVAQMGVFRYFGDGHRSSARFGHGGELRQRDNEQTEAVLRTAALWGDVPLRRCFRLRQLTSLDS